MNSDVVISVDHAGKSYRLWDNPSTRLIAPLLETVSSFTPGFLPLRNALQTKARGMYRDFWALQEVSFQVRRGQSLAIIGRNGSGKSTLLQIIAGTLRTTVGSVNVTGRVAALLELGSGFNPEFTGRENIYLNAALFGYSRQDIDSRFADIASFADIGDFIEQPVKIYSSGMVVRLAFAVAVHVDPDILIVDEALSVGDARFQLKCARAIDRFLARGVTLLFVSHDTTMVKRLCQQAVLLEHGRMAYAGNPNDVVNLYSKLIVEGCTLADLAPDIAALQAANHPARHPADPPAPLVASKIRESENSSQPTDPSPVIAQLQLRLKAMDALWAEHREGPAMRQRLAELLESERRHVQVSGAEFAYGGDLGRIQSVAMLDATGETRTWFATCEPIVVRMRVEAHEDFHEPIFALTIKNLTGVEIYGTNTLFSRQRAAPFRTGEARDVDFSFNLNLLPGHYFISVGFTHFVGEQLVVVHRRYDTIKFEVHGVDGAFGIANLQAKISARDPRQT